MVKIRSWYVEIIVVYQVGPERDLKEKSESEVAQSCPTLSDPMDFSLPGSSVHGIFQARVLEWVAIAFSVKMLTSVLNYLATFLKTVFSQTLPSAYY